MSDDKDEKLRVGRPPMPFDQEIADYICDRIASESVSMKTICSEEGMPSDVTVWKWLHRYPDFASQYARAKEAQQHVVMDETNDIADDGRNDYMERLNFDGSQPGWHLNGEAVTRSRLRIENRRWIAAHLAPKVYGEKLAIDQKTTLDVADPVKALLDEVLMKNQRLMPKIDGE